MEDLGAPISYLVLARGTPIYSSDGEKVGEVDRVLADEQSDIFEGIVLDTNSILPGGKQEIPAAEIDELYERGVVLTAAS